MIAGTVQHVTKRHDGVIVMYVSDRDNQDSGKILCYPKRSDTGEIVEVNVGDRVWTQGSGVLWNPKGNDASGKTPRIVNGKYTYDIPLVRVF
jgi:hypothetical protein